MFLCAMAVSATAQETPLKFAFLTDLHYSAGSGSVKDLSRCVKDVNTLDSLQSRRPIVSLRSLLQAR